MTPLFRRFPPRQYVSGAVGGPDLSAHLPACWERVAPFSLPLTPVFGLSDPPSANRACQGPRVPPLTSTGIPEPLSTVLLFGQEVVNGRAQMAWFLQYVAKKHHWGAARGRRRVSDLGSACHGYCLIAARMCARTGRASGPAGSRELPRRPGLEGCSGPERAGEARWHGMCIRMASLTRPEVQPMVYGSGWRRGGGDGHEQTHWAGRAVDAGSLACRAYHGSLSAARGFSPLRYGREGAVYG